MLVHCYSNDGLGDPLPAKLDRRREGWGWGRGGHVVSKLQKRSTKTLVPSLTDKDLTFLSDMPALLLRESQTSDEAI